MTIFHTVPYTHADAATLVTCLYHEQVRRYGQADLPGSTDQADLTPPQGLFLVGYTASGVPVARGGWRLIDDITAEIKRLFVRPDHRGAGCGRALLTTLESTAARAGAVRVLLETGVHNDHALALFAAHGYTPVPSYVAGRNPAINRALTKPLRDAIGHADAPSPRQ
ncbi:GNAT family N-acetyltransferase [Herbidospora cretacea]|uniref:GNAT family N-acetyltransferase n=1 Tax=Herbidospora cretacea TaxID=28444 RepID=UPI0009DD924C|nr:GNAT family N-acetyltransferase [Herbidospora cretacea]